MRRNLRVVFTDLFNNECRDRFNVTENEIKAIIELDPQPQFVEELELRLFVGQVTRGTDSPHVLVVTRWVEDEAQVQLAFPLLPGTVQNAGDLNPIRLLQQLAQDFGLTIRIGNQHNKFIFRERIPYGEQPEKLVEILNPENHRFIQSVYVKAEPTSHGGIVHCALAYCIDTDAYLSSLMGIVSIDGVSIAIAPQMRGRMTHLDLITSNGTVLFWTSVADAHVGGMLFQIRAPDFYFQIGFKNGNFYIFRNKFEAEIAVPDVSKNMFCCATWSPTELSALTLESSLPEAETLDAIMKRTKRIATPPTIPPNSLVDWARKRRIIPVVQYRSVSDFYLEVINSLQSLEDKVVTANCYDAFWNITYNGASILERKPKREEEILPTIHGLLFDIKTAKNLQVLPEHTIGAGKLDFLISGTLTSGETAKVCVEFKQGHSMHLEDGLLKQLPAYMSAEGCSLGAYCVMFFKGEYFEEPKNLNIDSLGFHLDMLASQNGLSNIRVLVLDFSRHKQPSKL